MDSLPFDNLVARLDGVRKAHCGDGIARAVSATCPACGKAHKLGIAETAAGWVLVNCFVCGGAVEPLRALWLDMSDLYPPRAAHRAGSNGGPMV